MRISNGEDYGREKEVSILLSGIGGGVLKVFVATIP
jgi:hypothetical protein